MVKASAKSKGTSRGTARVGFTLGWNLGSQEPNEERKGAPWSAGLAGGEGAALSLQAAAEGQHGAKRVWQVKGTAWPGGISRALRPPGWGQAKASWRGECALPRDQQGMGPCWKHQQPVLLSGARHKGSPGSIPEGQASSICSRAPPEQALTKGWRSRAGQGCPARIQAWIPVEQPRVRWV